jgi:hypothetical protein
VVPSDAAIDGPDPFADSAPAAWCDAPEGTILSEADGHASCDLRLGDARGTFYVNARIGGAVEYQRMQIRID